MPTTKDASAPAPAASLLSQIITSPQNKPPRIFMYGVHGIGKTTFGAKAPNPIMICTEEGAEQLSVARFPLSTSSDEVLSCLRTLYKEPHEYKTVVIDTADWLEDMIAAELVKKHSAADLSFGKDSGLAMERMAEVLVALNYLRDKRSMTSIIVAHSEVRRFDSPMTEPYDRYQPKLMKPVSALLQEWADVVLFATYDVTVKKEKVGFNQEVRRGMSSGERVMYTEERPAYLAKNRYGLTGELELSWDALAKELPYFKGEAK